MLVRVNFPAGVAWVARVGAGNVGVKDAKNAQIEVGRVVVA